MSQRETQRKSSTAASCHCGAQWGGARTAHCGSCHETFTGIAMFDAHRRMVGEHNECRSPADVGLVDAGRPYSCWGSGETDDRWSVGVAEGEVPS